MAIRDIEVQGDCASAFDAVRGVFAQNFTDYDELGAAVAVYRDGEPVVDLWAGHADEQRTRLWRADTIVYVSSTTKGMTSLCAHVLADRGLLDFDAPVAEYWPEFAQAGKECIAVRDLLSHQSGLAAIREQLPMKAVYDWGLMTSVLAAEAPWWEPGTQHGYHGMTMGWLVGEVVRRISGKSLGTFFREEVAEPLGIDFLIGFGPEHDERVADLAWSTPASSQQTWFTPLLADPNSLSCKALSNPLQGPLDTREFRVAEIPAVNGHGNARALARLYAALSLGGELEGIRILRPATIEAAIAEQVKGLDTVLRFETRYGLGFWLATEMINFGSNENTFGHPGMGGSGGFADYDAKIGFGYTVNRLISGPTIEDPRRSRLVDAVYASL